jgi:hypothetical protein
LIAYAKRNTKINFSKITYKSFLLQRGLSFSFSRKDFTNKKKETPNLIDGEFMQKTTPYRTPSKTRQQLAINTEGNLKWEKLEISFSNYR